MSHVPVRCGWRCMGCEGDAAHLVTYKRATTRVETSTPMCRSCANVFEHGVGGFAQDWIRSAPIPDASSEVTETPEEDPVQSLCKHGNPVATMYCPQCMVERPGGPCGRCGGPTLDCGVDALCPKCDPIRTREEMDADAKAAYERWQANGLPPAIRARLESAARVQALLIEWWSESIKSPGDRTNLARIADRIRELARELHDSRTAPPQTLLTDRERHVMVHATAWDHPRSPLYRNHFCARPGHEDWGTIQALVARGLMAERGRPSELSGGDHTFAVTNAGMEALAGTPRLLAAWRQAVSELLEDHPDLFSAVQKRFLGLLESVDRRS